MSIEEAGQSKQTRDEAELDGEIIEPREAVDHRLDDLATANADREAEWLAGQRRRRPVPSLRIINAGAFVLRVAGILIIILGFWPFFLGTFHAIWWFQGEPNSIKISASATHVLVSNVGGWFATLYFVIGAIVIWCVATVVLAFAHALYVIRDLSLRIHRT
jgi:hypothetical protein